MIQREGLWTEKPLTLTLTLALSQRGEGMVQD